jgi:hypothetical protein
MVAFYDRYWNDRWTSSVGYSLLNIQNVPACRQSTQGRPLALNAQNTA